MNQLDKMSILARYFSPYLTGALLIGLLVISCPPPAGYAATETENAEQTEPAAEAEATAETEQSEDVFDYSMDNRPDPFRPFIEDKVATQLDPNEIIDNEIELSGMQLFEPGQLRLVAVMFADDQKIAFVEDVTGQGYAIKEGMLIGRHGKVSQIEKDHVIVTETAQTRAGKEIITTIVMRLNKEGDK